MAAAPAPIRRRRRTRSRWQVFARQLAAALDEAVAARRPHRVVLVAPPRFLGHLREALSKPVSALVGASLDHDLSAVPEHELPARLADLL